MKIHTTAFLISFGIGIFIVYISTPLPEVIIMYPTPDNYRNYIYKDINQICYQYDMIKTTCPKKKDEIYSIPIQNISEEKKNHLSILNDWKRRLNHQETSDAYAKISK